MKEKGGKDPDIEGQIPNKAEVKTSSENNQIERPCRFGVWPVLKLIVPRIWIKEILLVLGVFSVAVDALFFYLPVINEERKCVALDRKLYITSTCLRTFLDSITLLNIILQCSRRPSIDNNARLPGQVHGVDEIDARSKAKVRYLWSLAIDVLAILPIPQMLLPIIFSKMRGSESLNGRKVLTAIFLFQYWPRALRIYPSWREVFTYSTNIMTSLSKTFIAVKAGFNLLLFIVASHIMGGLWYYLSFQRETTCWHLAGQSHTECDPSSFEHFDCDHGVGNYTFLNDYCPIETPNTTIFDFGIFQGALQSGTVASTDFPQKILYCFWWGLRNLSSFGSNLQTSPRIWENCFAVSISIFGLLLFMYFLGHLQMYMQWEASVQLEVARQRRLEDAQRKQKHQEKAKQLEDFEQRWKFRMQARRNQIIEWINSHPRVCEIKKEIIRLVDQASVEEETQIRSEAEENLIAAESKISPTEYEDIDAAYLLTHLPADIRLQIRHYLCFPLLRKVPLLQNESENLLTLIIKDFMKEVYYNENSYIAREGEPLDALLFITQGIVWTYTSKPDDRQTGLLKTDDCYGVELLEFMFELPPNSDFLPYASKLPFSTRTLRCHTKVEGFAFTARNMQRFIDHRWPMIDKFRESPKLQLLATSRSSSEANRLSSVRLS